MPYQTFDVSAPGDSNSLGKFIALNIGRDEWRGKRVLDVGCNAGYFVESALRHRAADVIGIERDEALCKEARKRICQYGPRGSILCQSWDQLPDGQFDFILMLSALHYEESPIGLLTRLKEKLKPNGKLVLEIGIAGGDGKRWESVTRSNGSTVKYPTMAQFGDLATCCGLTRRWMGRSVDQRGDPVPRHVVHCQRRKPSLMIISGPSGAGKSSLVDVMAGEIVHVDDIARRHIGDPQIKDLRPFYRDCISAKEGFIAEVINSLPTADFVTLDCLDSLELPIRLAAINAGWKVWTAKCDS